MTRVAFLEDVPLFRSILEQVLNEDASMELCVWAATCHQALTLIPPQNPDVVLLDLFLPDGHGFAVGIALRKALPELRVIILSENANPKLLSALPASERPYWSYLLKSGVNSREALLTAIQASRHRSLVDEQVKERPLTQSELRLELLTDRQREILSLIAAGLSNVAIAQRLFMSTKTVEYHLKQIYTMLQVTIEADSNSRVKAAMIYSDQTRGTRPPEFG